MQEVTLPLDAAVRLYGSDAVESVVLDDTGASGLVRVAGELADVAITETQPVSGYRVSMPRERQPNRAERRKRSHAIRKAISAAKRDGFRPFATIPQAGAQP